MSDPNKRILMLDKSKTGRRHDKRIAERQQILDYIPSDVSVWMDSDFAGLSYTTTFRYVATPPKTTS